MSYSQKALELAKKLVSHWSGWDKNEDFYLNKLIQELMLKPLNRDKTEKEIIGELQKLLTEKEWKDLPQLIRKTRVESVTRKIKAREEANKRILAQQLENEKLAEQKRKEGIRLDAEAKVLAKERARVAEMARKAAEKQLAEEERLAQLAETRRRERLAAIVEIGKSLQENYLATDAVFEEKYSTIITEEDYQTFKIDFIQKWVKQNLNYTPDAEQALAIGSFNNNIQLVARAGSGKTSTLVSRALFLNQHCRISVDQIMILAFNRDAVEEVETRLKKYLDSDDIPHVRTFHSLAYALVHPAENLLFDDNKNGMGKKSQALQEVIDSKIRSEESFPKIKALMLNQFSDEWEKIIEGGYNKSPEKFVKFRRDLPDFSIKGEPLKSYGEKMIADFLFEHNVDYYYENNHRWNDRTYRPDFTIKTGKSTGVIIEYFGMLGDPEYDIQILQKRDFWRQKEGYELIELYPKDLAQGKDVFVSHISVCLQDHQIPFRKLTETEIWEKIKDRALGRFTNIVNSFIQLCRKQGLTPDVLQQRIFADETLDNKEREYLPLFAEIYQEYLDYLAATGSEDFDGLMSRAADRIGAKSTAFISKGQGGNLLSVNYFMLDEFQDFSQQFHQLIAAIQTVNPRSEFFCVGDDWQAINGFAGSDLNYYQNFSHFFQNSRKLVLKRNYRSTPEVVELSNNLMAKLGTPALSTQNGNGSVKVAYFENLKITPREIEGFKYDTSTIGLLRLVQDALTRDKEVVLLLRKNSNPWNISHHLEDRDKVQAGQNEFLNMVRMQFSEAIRHKIQMSTAHKFKGKEAQAVIILGATKDNYPLVHGDWVYNQFLGASVDKIEQEERRLFYVAITRAVSEITFVTQVDSESKFLQELRCWKPIETIDWNTLPPIKLAGTSIIVTILSSFDIKDSLKADGFRYDSSNKSWWKSYPAETKNLVAYFKTQTWSNQARQVTVKIDDDCYTVTNGVWIKTK